MVSTLLLATTAESGIKACKNAKDFLLGSSSLFDESSLYKAISTENEVFENMGNLNFLTEVFGEVLDLNNDFSNSSDFRDMLIKRQDAINSCNSFNDVKSLARSIVKSFFEDYDEKVFFDYLKPFVSARSKRFQEEVEVSKRSSGYSRFFLENGKRTRNIDNTYCMEYFAMAESLDVQFVEKAEDFDILRHEFFFNLFNLDQIIHYKFEEQTLSKENEKTWVVLIEVLNVT
jgi:hypothetical protein